MPSRRMPKGLRGLVWVLIFNYQITKLPSYQILDDNRMLHQQPGQNSRNCEHTDPTFTSLVDVPGALRLI